VKQYVCVSSILVETGGCQKNSSFVCDIAGHITVKSTMSGRAVLSDTLEVKTTDVAVTRQAHFESSKTSPLVSNFMFQCSTASDAGSGPQSLLVSCCN